jgi:hypothetical protein
MHDDIFSENAMGLERTIRALCREELEMPVPGALGRADIVGRYRLGSGPQVDVWRVQEGREVFFELHCNREFIATFESRAGAAVAAAYLVAETAEDPFYARSFAEFLSEPATSGAALTATREELCDDQE